MRLLSIIAVLLVYHFLTTSAQLISRYVFPMTDGPSSDRLTFPRCVPPTTDVPSSVHFTYPLETSFSILNTLLLHEGYSYQEVETLAKKKTHPTQPGSSNIRNPTDYWGKKLKGSEISLFQWLILDNCRRGIYLCIPGVEIWLRSGGIHISE